MEKPGSSNWSVAEHLFSPRLRRGFGHICANELSPACYRDQGDTDTRDACTARLAPPCRQLGAPGPCSTAKAPGGPLAAGRRGGAAAPLELRMLPPAAERWLQPGFPRLPRSSRPAPSAVPPARSGGCCPLTRPGSPRPLSHRAGTGTRGKPGAGAASAPRSLRAGGAPCRGRTPGEGTVPCALPLPSPLAASSPGHWD